MKTKLFLFALLIIASCNKPIAVTTPKYNTKHELDVLLGYGFTKDSFFVKTPSGDTLGTELSYKLAIPSDTKGIVLHGHGTDLVKIGVPDTSIVIINYIK